MSQFFTSVYPNSVHKIGDCSFFIARTTDSEKRLVVVGKEMFSGFQGEEIRVDGRSALLCELNTHNGFCLMEIFPFTKPKSHKGADFTFGFGDRLGIAAPGHIDSIRGKDLFPILAQQSVREITLTERSFKEVLCDAAFSVFQEDWQEGYGADGDHLKTEEEIQSALDCGYTMITLDCSQHIRNDLHGQSRDFIDKQYEDLPDSIRACYETAYSDRTFTVEDNRLFISSGDIKSIVLTYHEAISFTEDIFHRIINTCGRDIDFEVSIDETYCTTSPEAHFVVASELKKRGVAVASMAPRFSGEFQKGIDYIGDTAVFESEFKVHQSVARHFGYKLSIHSGSDKFKVFGIIGEHTGRKVHVKTSGTSWLEAVRVIASHAPALYREIHNFALEHFQEASAYYHIGADPDRIAPLDKVPNGQLADYLDDPNARQALHIIYGLLLSKKNEDGTYRYKNELYHVLRQNEDAYRKALKDHIWRHLDSLGAADLHMEHQE